jgi:hypothetical protein
MTIDINTLTINEQAAALTLLAECLNGMCGKVPEDLEADEYTWCDADMLIQNGWSKEAAAGTYGALIAKGVVTQMKGEPCDVLDGWREVATLWGLWVAAGEAREGLYKLMNTGKDAGEELIKDLEKAAAAEAEQIAIGIPFPGLICATLRQHAAPWQGSRKSFIELVAKAGYNRATAATQWQRARGK